MHTSKYTYVYEMLQQKTKECLGEGTILHMKVLNYHADDQDARLNIPPGIVMRASVPISDNIIIQKLLDPSYW